MPEEDSLYNEDILLSRLKAGEHRAFDTLYKRYRTPIYANILKLVKSHDYATELLQEVFLKVWQRRAYIDSSLNFKAYLLRIAQNTVYDFFRKASREQVLENTLISLTCKASYSPVEDQLYFRETQANLEKALNRLPEKCRKVFIMCKLEGKSYDEVSKLLNISTATINNHIVKATRILKKYWLFFHGNTLLLTIFLLELA